MLENFRQWYLRNQVAITWFLIGWLAFGGFIHFGHGEYISALVLWGIAVINYVFVVKNP